MAAYAPITFSTEDSERVRKPRPFSVLLSNRHLMPSDRTHHVYILECADGTFYTGYTTDVERRIEEHGAGEGARYTRGRTPVDLVYTERFEGRSAAMRREYEIKQLSRTEKERLVRDPPR